MAAMPIVAATADEDDGDLGLGMCWPDCFLMEAGDGATV